LATPASPAGAQATALIAAQDIFFAAPPIADARAMTEGLAKNAAAADATQPALSSVAIAGHSFARLDLRGSPLSRIVLATDLRCHVVIFTFAAADPDRLGALAASLDHLQFSRGRPAPVCVEGYATAQTVLRRVEPVPAAPYFVSIPVRILVAADGRVAQVHVIRATSAQRSNITDALRQWRFEPYVLSGRPVEIETGLTFRFAPAAR
ncbi:MAG: energy transducer TonB, partial [Stellaceae bacterium]